VSGLVKASGLGGGVASRLPKPVQRALAGVEYDALINAKRIEAAHHVTTTGMLAATSILQTKRSLARDDPLADLALSDIAATGLNVIQIIITRTAFS